MTRHLSYTTSCMFCTHTHIDQKCERNSIRNASIREYLNIIIIIESEQQQQDDIMINAMIHFQLENFCYNNATCIIV